jgi:hypothetical protein
MQLINFLKIIRLRIKNELPWTTDGYRIIDSKGQQVGGLGSKENNELIVKSVNNHENLLGAFDELLYEAVNYWAGNELPSSFLEAISNAQAAIKDANT